MTSERLYRRWLLAVDRQLKDIDGRVHTDLPAWDWRAAYEDGYSAHFAARRALRDTSN